MIRETDTPSLHSTAALQLQNHPHARTVVRIVQVLFALARFTAIQPAARLLCVTSPPSLTFDSLSRYRAPGPRPGQPPGHTSLVVPSIGTFMIYDLIQSASKSILTSPGSPIFARFSDVGFGKSCPFLVSCQARFLRHTPFKGFHSATPSRLHAHSHRTTRRATSTQGLSRVPPHRRAPRRRAGGSHSVR